MAAAEQSVEAGNTEYHDDHMGTIFKKGFSFSGYERDLLTWNRGDGFLDVSGVSGVDSISDGRGSSFADFDNDGDLDIFLTTEQGEAHFLFRNNVGSAANSLRVELVGTTSGRDAFGSVVRLDGPIGRQAKLKAGGSGYLSQSDPRLTFGLGESDVARNVEVVWPDGTMQALGDVPAGAAIRVTQGSEGYETLNVRRFALADPLPPEEAFLARTGLRLGKVFPELPLADLDGAESSLEATAAPGRRQLVNIWATWCVPCAQEIPELQRIQGRLRSAGIDLVGVSVDAPDTVGAVPGYLEARGVTYPIRTTDLTGLETLYPDGEATVPLTVLLDDELRVLRVFTGWSARTEAEILSLTP